MRNYQFDGKVVFVTGAASGIGAAQAKLFLASEAKVYCLDNRVPEELLRKHPNFSWSVGDVSLQNVVTLAVRECLQKFGKVDIILNTAGILDEYKTTLETDLELWNQVIAVNITAMYLVTNALLPQMIERQEGVIINMASVAGMVAGGGGAAYTASKHAIVGYTKQLAYDYAKHGIRCNAIAPGAVQTPMTASDFAGSGKISQEVAAETPCQRWAQPEEIAAFTLFLASNDASYIHGAILPIDGGWTIK
jgi:Dehydrogenases with different specificities (related to short-chain alcohol dehydrogenases)